MSLEIKEVTVFAFSIENFKRPASEVDAIFDFLVNRVKYLSLGDVGDKARIRIIGNKSLIKPEILSQLNEIQEKSDHPDREYTLNICVAYTSRDEMTHAIRETARQRDSMQITKDVLTPSYLQDQMYFGNETRPIDILIRTSGQRRLSDFLLWQSALQCQIEFLRTLWPDFNFFEFYGIMLKWSYSQYYSQIRYATKSSTFHAPSVDLHRLPPSPPLATVSERST